MADAPSRTRDVTFEIQAQPGSTVHVAGTFNDWTPEEHPLRDQNGDGIFSTVIPLPPGRHEYKFVINGVWCIDPECTEWVRNEYGSLNSVVTVR